MRALISLVKLQKSNNTKRNIYITFIQTVKKKPKTNKN